jgi:hypothetical protein
MNNEDKTLFISKITQTDGLVAVERAAAGALVLTSKEDETETYTVPSEAKAIVKTDNIITAFGKVEA